MDDETLDVDDDLDWTLPEISAPRRMRASRVKRMIIEREKWLRWYERNHKPIWAEECRRDIERLRSGEFRP